MRADAWASRCVAPSTRRLISTWSPSVDVGDALLSVADAGAQVVVDFTQPDVVMDNLRFAIDKGIHAVVGTTGFTAERLDTVRGWLAERPERRRDRRAELRHRRRVVDEVRRSSPRGSTTRPR